MPGEMKRRDFIKLLTAFISSTALSGSSLPAPIGAHAAQSSENVLILVFDALSASNVSLYGYPRRTTPNLEILADRSTVYHSHYSAGNFTTPGTGSILSGSYPWTHRGLQLSSKLSNFFTTSNIFSLYKDAGYTTVGFSQNPHVHSLLDQFRESIDLYLPASEAALIDFNFSDDLLFGDYGVASRAEAWYLRNEFDFSNSLFMSILHWLFIRSYWARRLENEMASEFPRGIPNHSFVLFPLDETIGWLSDFLITLPQPYFAYVHLLPPHDPYNPSREFVGLFEDDFVPDPKQRLRFFSNSSEAELNRVRRKYDEFVAYADHYLGVLISDLEKRDAFDNTWMVFTSDHGEMFERGIWKHITPTLYEPVSHVPLLISAPNQSARVDVHANTSAVDLVPTLMQIIGQNVPAWSEGVVLPEFSAQPIDNMRSIFVVEAKENSNKKALRKATFSIRKGDLKLIYYAGYPSDDGVFELYRISDDPGELVDLSARERSTALLLRDELLTKLEQVNQLYQ